MSEPGEGMGSSGEVARGDECSSCFVIVTVIIVILITITCITGMTLLVGITGKPFLSSTTEVTIWLPSLNRIIIVQDVTKMSFSLAPQSAQEGIVGTSHLEWVMVLKYLQPTEMEHWTQFKNEIGILFVGIPLL